MKICKFRKLSEEEIKKLEQLMAGSSFVLEEIKKVLNEELVKRNKPVSEESFKQTDWALQQAFNEGIKKGLTIALEYVTI